MMVLAIGSLQKSVKIFASVYLPKRSGNTTRLNSFKISMILEVGFLTTWLRKKESLLDNVFESCR